MTSMVYLKQPYAGVVKSFIVHTDALSHQNMDRVVRLSGKQCEGWVTAEHATQPILCNGLYSHVLQAQPHLDYVCLELLQHCLPGGIVGDEEQWKSGQLLKVENHKSRYSEPPKWCLPFDFQ